MKRTHTHSYETHDYDEERPSKVRRSENSTHRQGGLELNLSGSMDLSSHFLETIHDTMFGSHVVSLNLSFCHYLVDDDLALLMGNQINPNIKYINLSFTQITDLGVMFITSKCPSLTRVTLKGCRGITHVSLSYLAQFCKHVQELVLSECPNIGDRGVQLIAQEINTNLTMLDMGDCPNIREDKTLLYLAHFCPNLSSLRLKNTCLSMTLLAKLLTTQNRFHLSELNLQGNQSITDSFITILSKFQKSLKVLDVSFCPNLTFHNGIQKIVSHLTELSELHVFGMRVSEGNCESVRLLKPSLILFV